MNLAVDYSQKLEPLLADEDAKWAEQILMYQRRNNLSQKMSLTILLNTYPFL